MKILIALVLVLTFSPAISQNFPWEKWYNGKVYFENEQTIEGPIKYDLDHELINVQVNGQIQTYTASTLSNFEIINSGISRIFYAFPFVTSNKYESPKLFEVIVVGEFITLLSRERIIVENLPSYNFYTNSNIYNTETKVGYDYFFLFPSGKIAQIKPDEKAIHTLFPEKNSEIGKFVRSENISPQNKESLMALVEYYNALTR